MTKVLPRIEQLVTELDYDVPFEMKITGEHLLQLLRASKVPIPRAGVEVEFVVPGGGDWSGSAIDITEEDPIRIRWKIRKTINL